jgi:Holliday junction resolvase
MKESQFCLELKKSLRKYGWFIKFHGGQFTEPGVPDLIGCIKGRFVAIECKVNGGQLSEHQRQQIANIQVYANGSSYVIMLQKGKPSSPTCRLEIGDGKNYELNESWTDYCDLHYCVDCFKKTEIGRMIL